MHYIKRNTKSLKDYTFELSKTPRFLNPIRTLTPTLQDPTCRPEITLGNTKKHKSNQT